jgi:hypothetical protein
VSVLGTDLFSRETGFAESLAAIAIAYGDGPEQAATILCGNIHAQTEEVLRCCDVLARAFPECRISISREKTSRLWLITISMEGETSKHQFDAAARARLYNLVEPSFTACAQAEAYKIYRSSNHARIGTRIVIRLHIAPVNPHGRRQVTSNDLMKISGVTNVFIDPAACTVIFDLGLAMGRNRQTLTAAVCRRFGAFLWGSVTLHDAVPTPRWHQVELGHSNRDSRSTSRATSALV